MELAVLGVPGQVREPLHDDVDDGHKTDVVLPPVLLLEPDRERESMMMVHKKSICVFSVERNLSSSLPATPIIHTYAGG